MKRLVILSAAMAALTAMGFACAAQQAPAGDVPTAPGPAAPVPAQAAPAPTPPVRGLVASRTAGLVACPLITQPPTVDGALGDAAYERAQPLRITAYLDKASVNFPTEAWLCRDQKNIYLAVRCLDDQLDQLVTGNKGSLLWKNDCVEVTFVPDKKEAFFAKFIIDCQGRVTGGTWVSDEWGEPTAGPAVAVVVKTGREKGAWTLEAAFPITAFGAAVTEKSVWAFGLQREKYSPPVEVSSYQGGFNKPKEYPDLVFDGRSIIFDGLGVRNIGSAAASGMLQLSLPRDGSTDVRSFPFELKPGERSALPEDVLLDLRPGAAFELQAAVAGAAAGPMIEKYVMVAPPKAYKMSDAPEAAETVFFQSPFDDPDFFAVMVWLQPASPKVLQEYKALGVNVFMGGLDSYPSPKGKAWLDALWQAGLYAVIEFSEPAVQDGLYKHPAMAGWVHLDEPDLMNADQSGPVATPEMVAASFARIRELQPAHRVFLNLSQSVAYERFVGKAVPDEAYPRYLRGCDVVQYDIYPCNSFADGGERLHLVAKGLDRLNQWAEGKKMLGFAIETNKFTPPGAAGSRAPTAEEFQTEAWMAIVHGARYLNLFCHSWSKELDPQKAVEVAGIYPHIKAVLPRVTGQIKSLAKVINSPTVKDKVTVATTLGSRVDVLVKELDGSTYVFAVNMFKKPEKAAFTVKGLEGAKVEVLFESRSLEAKGGAFADDFAPYAVHRYKISAK